MKKWTETPVSVYFFVKIALNPLPNSAVFVKNRRNRLRNGIGYATIPV